MSMTEVMVSLVILGIMLGVSLPAFSSLLQSNNLQNAGRDVSGHFRLARSLAVSTAVSHIVDWDPDASTYRVVRDSNGDGDVDMGEPLVGSFTLPNRVAMANPDTIGFTNDRVTFLRNGSSSESGTLVLSNDRGHTKSIVLLAPTGQVRVE
jgi:Tfp pilus assembly protein FimT